VLFHSTGTCGKDPMLHPPFSFFLTSIFFHINNILQLSMYHCMTYIDLFILKNMGVTIIDFRVCPPLEKCKNLMFSGFIDTLMYSFSSTGVTIYCYFGLKFNDNTCCEVI
jgi:hypothetical protein